MHSIQTGWYKSEIDKSIACSVTKGHLKKKIPAGVLKILENISVGLAIKIKERNNIMNNFLTKYHFALSSLSNVNDFLKGS